MINIIRVTPGQWAQMMNAIPKDQRSALPSFPTNNFFVPSSRTLIVIDDEVRCVVFPKDQPLTVYAAVEAGLAK